MPADSSVKHYREIDSDHVDNLKAKQLACDYCGGDPPCFNRANYKHPTKQQR